MDEERVTSSGAMHHHKACPIESCDYNPMTWHDHEREATDKFFDRLMELWQQPWSEPAYGEAQMLLSRLRAPKAAP